MDRRRGGGRGERSHEEPERDEEDRDEGTDRLVLHSRVVGSAREKLKSVQ
jgi:hypothetical protein